MMVDMKRKQADSQHLQLRRPTPHTPPHTSAHTHAAHTHHTHEDAASVSVLEGEAHGVRVGWGVGLGAPRSSEQEKVVRLEKARERYAEEWKQRVIQSRKDVQEREKMTPGEWLEICARLAKKNLGLQ